MKTGYLTRMIGSVTQQNNNVYEAKVVDSHNKEIDRRMIIVPEGQSPEEAAQNTLNLPVAPKPKKKSE